MPITIEDQIACVRREIGFRQRLYPRWVKQEKLTQAAADRELAMMQAVFQTLVDLGAKEGAAERLPGLLRSHRARVLELVYRHVPSSVAVKIDAAIKREFGASEGRAYCRRCECIQVTIDDGETCAVCRLVL